MKKKDIKVITFMRMLALARTLAILLAVPLRDSCGVSVEVAYKRQNTANKYLQKNLNGSLISKIKTLITESFFCYTVRPFNLIVQFLL